MNEQKGTESISLQVTGKDILNEECTGQEGERVWKLKYVCMKGGKQRKGQGNCGAKREILSHESGIHSIKNSKGKKKKGGDQNY